MYNRLLKGMVFRNAFRVFILSLVASVPLHAAERTQTLELDVGWNSVWLEVVPVDTNGFALSVSNVFASGDFDIDIVARPVEAVGTVEYVDDPASLFNQAGWVVWYSTPESGENDLYPIEGNQAYLVHVSDSVLDDGESAGTLEVTGEVVFYTPSWVPRNYNLLGFGLSGNPTFEEFFAGSRLDEDTADPYLVYRLDSASGAWEAVELDTDTMNSGEAYWILWPFASSSSEFAGPVAVLFSGLDSLDFGEGPGTIEVDDPQGDPGDTLLLSRQELTLGNLDASAHVVTLAKIDPDTSGEDALNDALRLYALEPQPESLAWQLAPSGQVTEWAITNLAGAGGLTVTLGADRNWDGGASERENLYRIEVGLGGGTNFCYYWLPVTAENADVSDSSLGATDSSYMGLWIGEVSLNAVTSITEDGNPVTPTTSVAPMQLLIHVDTNGVASLLKHVMFMQTKTADDTIESDPVLVLNEEKIPYFEGIEERDGKTVGRRLETVAYDMPRMMDTTTQTNLLDVVADAFGLTNLNEVAESNITLYVNSRESRPPDLEEEYYTSWPLEGALGINSIVRTATDSPLTMDPFHRGNPFRHAFHPSHGAGYAFERSMSITFDDTDEAGLLRGTYEETIIDLIAVPLSMEGSIVLQRVSTVGTLE